MTNDPSSAPPQDPAAGYAAVPEQPPAPSLFEQQPPPVADPAVAAEAVISPAAAPGPADRVWPSLLWDAILLLGAIAGVVMLLITGSMGDSFADTGTRLAGVAPILLLAIALGVSMRAGTVNLAVAQLAGTATLLYAVYLPQGEAIAWLIALGSALAGGVVIALAVVLLRAPAWAASIVVAVASTTTVGAGLDWEAVYETWPELELTATTAWLMVGGIAAVSIVGGVIAILRPVRRLLMRTSQSVEQTGGSTPATAFTVFGALALSGVLAGAAGVLSLAPGGIEISPLGNSSDGFIFLGFALAIVLLGGTSARGGRGGVIGTVCAAILLYGLSQFLVASDADQTALFALPIGLMVIGLVVSRFLGGGRRAVIEDETPEPAPVQPEPMPVYTPAPQAETGATVPLQEHGFAQTLPGQSVPAGTVVGDPAGADPAVQQYWPPEENAAAPPPPAAPEEPTQQIQPPPDAPSQPVSPAAAESAPPGFEQPDPPPDPYQYRPPAQ